MTPPRRPRLSSLLLAALFVAELTAYLLLRPPTPAPLRISPPAVTEPTPVRTARPSPTTPVSPHRSPTASATRPVLPSPTASGGAPTATASLPVPLQPSGTPSP